MTACFREGESSSDPPFTAQHVASRPLGVALGKSVTSGLVLHLEFSYAAASRGRAGELGPRNDGGAAWLVLSTQHGNCIILRTCWLQGKSPGPPKYSEHIVSLCSFLICLYDGRWNESYEKEEEV